MGIGSSAIVYAFSKGSEIPKCYTGTHDHTFARIYIYIHTICEMRCRPIYYNQLLMNINEPPHASTSSGGPGVGVGTGGGRVITTTVLS